MKPTLTQQRESAAASFLGECTAVDAKSEPPTYEFAIRRWFTGQSLHAGEQTAKLPLTQTLKLGALALLLSSGDDSAKWETLKWQCVPLSEIGFAYVGRAPDLRTPAAKRLEYFAKFLEHSDPLVAEDAFQEFGQVPYDLVASSASILSATKLREWIVDPAIPDERKGFYGLALGLTAQGKDRPANLEVLHKLVDAEATAGSDFRTGFDGILGGLLVAESSQAIEHLTRQLLANSKAAVGDLQHAEKALRFYYEFGPAADRPAVATAAESLLDRPTEAAVAITDLARWQHWTPLDKIAGLYPQKDFADAGTRRAIVGFLLACPRPEAADALKHLREYDPKGVAAAEQTLQALGGKN